MPKCVAVPTHAWTVSGWACRAMQQAIVFDVESPSGLRLTEVARPKLTRGTALVKVMACGVNPVDAKFIIGDKLPEAWMDWSARKASGHTPGFDFSGVVIQVNATSSGLQPGDPVYGLACDPSKFLVTKLKGSLAEYILAPIDQLAKKPTALSHAEAAAIPLAGTTAVQAFRQNKVGRGQRVLIIGASGGVGHIAVQVARHLGAHVTAVCSTRNVPLVGEECGANTVLSYDDGDVYDKLARDVAASGPFDFVFDCVSSADARDQAASYMARVRSMQPPALRPAAKYVVLGGATWHWGLALVKRLLRLNCFERGFELFWIKMPGSRPVLEELAAMADAQPAGGIKPLKAKTTVLNFSEAAAREALEMLRGRRTAGKVVLSMEPVDET